jgi:hypothetical protein
MTSFADLYSSKSRSEKKSMLTTSNRSVNRSVNDMHFSVNFEFAIDRDEVMPDVFELPRSETDSVLSQRLLEPSRTQSEPPACSLENTIGSTSGSNKATQFSHSTFSEKPIRAPIGAARRSGINGETEIWANSPIAIKTKSEEKKIAHHDFQGAITREHWLLCSGRPNWMFIAMFFCMLFSFTIVQILMNAPPNNGYFWGIYWTETWLVVLIVLLYGLAIWGCVLWLTTCDGRIVKSCFWTFEFAYIMANVVVWSVSQNLMSDKGLFPLSATMVTPVAIFFWGMMFSTLDGGGITCTPAWRQRIRLAFVLFAIGYMSWHMLYYRYFITLKPVRFILFKSLYETDTLTLASHAVTSIFAFSCKFLYSLLRDPTSLILCKANIRLSLSPRIESGTSTGTSHPLSRVDDTGENNDKITRHYWDTATAPEENFNCS